MNNLFTLSFYCLCRGLLPALLLWAFPLLSCATPVFEVLHSFGPPPANPQAKLIQGSDGNFYGTTSSGGSSGEGSVFRMTPSGTLTTLVDFDGTNGSYPTAGLVQGTDGNFYGTTSGNASDGEAGTVFRMTPSGTLTTLVHFNHTNGRYPDAELVQGSDGNFYGTTAFGGDGGEGTVFRMTPSGTLTTLVHFDGSNGRLPRAGLVLGSDGNFYGTTSSFSYYGDFGTVFRMTPSGTLTTLVHFDGTNGIFPEAGLVLGSDGNFYGTTQNGGSSGSGTVFRMTPSGTLTTLVHFNHTNGSYPEAELVQGSDGNFYGTTADGGNGGEGTVFQMTPSGTLTTLVRFYGSNSSAPRSGLVQGGDGNFYGTTFGSSFYGDFGTVFKMTASGTLTTLVNFKDFTNGLYPNELVQGSDGNLYGTTVRGGSGGYGTVFRVTPSGEITNLVLFDDETIFSDGGYPNAGLVQGSDGNFYGTTEIGGNGGGGTVFRMTPSGALTTLVHFDGTNGSAPRSGLVQGGDGNFYGTTSGSAYNADFGTVFRMTPSGTLTTLMHFDGTNGFFPQAELVQGIDGNFYGTTSNASLGDFGSVFRMTPSGTLTTLVHFDGTNGLLPQAGLVQGSDGNFYGTTTDGGIYGLGTVFQMTPNGTLTTLVHLDGTNGLLSQARLVQGSDGHLYGATSTIDGELARGFQIYRLRIGGATVLSQDQTNVTSDGATLGGDVTSQGASNIIGRGVVYSLASANPDPAIGGAGVTQLATSGTTGTFTVNATGLAPSSTYAFKAYATNSNGTSYSDVAIFTTPPSLAGALDTNGLTYISGGNANWFAQTVTTSDGAYAAQSGTIGDNEETWFQTSVTGPGNLSFRWKVSSESDYDRLEFYIDGVPQSFISGEEDWATESHAIMAGSHTLSWRYAKDGVYSSGLDAGWVDQIVWAPTGGYQAAAGAAGLSGNNAQPLATPHNDGVANLIKYAFNMNLSGSDSRTLVSGTGNAGLPAIGLTGTGASTMLRVEFLRRKGSGLIYTPMRSSTLSPGSFVAMSGTPVVTSIDDNWERVVIQESANPATLPKSFAMVEVRLP